MLEAQRRAEELGREVSSHKAAIRARRTALKRAAAALEALKRDCAQRGIKLIYVGEGKETHGHQTTTEDTNLNAEA